MKDRCEITNSECTAVEAGFYDCGDSCPIGKYENSNRINDNGVFVFNATCKYCNSSRAEQAAYNRQI